MLGIQVRELRYVPTPYNILLQNEMLGSINISLPHHAAFHRNPHFRRNSVFYRTHVPGIYEEGLRASLVMRGEKEESGKRLTYSYVSVYNYQAD